MSSPSEEGGFDLHKYKDVPITSGTHAGRRPSEVYYTIGGRERFDIRPHMATTWTVDLESFLRPRYVINPYAAELLQLPAHVQSLGECLRVCARIMAPPLSADSFFLADPAMRRALTAQYFPADKPCLCLPDGKRVTYGWLMSKGNGPSGKAYGIVSDEMAITEADIPEEGALADPIGFFGSDDAKKEIFISNALALSNARIGMPIGSIEIDGDELRTALPKIWNPDLYRGHTVHEAKVAQGRDYLLRQLDKMTQAPSILVRFTGSLDRFPDYRTAIDQNKLAAFSSFVKDYGVGDGGVNAILTRQELSDAQFQSVVEAIKAYKAHQVAALKQGCYLLQASGYDATPHRLLRSKDVDLSFIVQDFEEIPLREGKPTTNIQAPHDVLDLFLSHHFHWMVWSRDRDKNIDRWNILDGALDLH